MAKNSLLISIAVVALLLVLISGCAKQQTSCEKGSCTDGRTYEKYALLNGKCVELNYFQDPCAVNGVGNLTGKVSIGPLCPVERIPPDPGCQPTQETYNAWPIAVWTTDKTTKIVSIAVAADGTFNVQLRPGEYVVDLDKEQAFGLGGRNLPATVTIKPRETTTLDINIDTGIR